MTLFQTLFLFNHWREPQPVSRSAEFARLGRGVRSIQQWLGPNASPSWCSARRGSRNGTLPGRRETRLASSQGACRDPGLGHFPSGGGGIVVRFRRTDLSIRDEIQPTAAPLSLTSNRSTSCEQLLGSLILDRDSGMYLRDSRIRPVRVLGANGSCRSALGTRAKSRASGQSAGVIGVDVLVGGVHVEAVHTHPRKELRMVRVTTPVRDTTRAAVRGPSRGAGR